MPRNKTAKRSAKRNSTATKPVLSATQKMEKDFISIPAKLAAQVEKEVAALKQKENKLKTALQKTKAQAKNWETRIKAAAKAKNTASSKKQLSAAKKAHSQVSKTHNELSKELIQVSKMLDVATNHQAKFNAIGKLLRQFEKEWVRNSKKAKATKKVKAKVKRSTVKAKTRPTATEHVPHFEPTEITTSGNEIRFDDTTEITS